MRGLKSLVTGAILSSAGIGGSLNYHVLHTANGLELLPKKEMTFRDTFVDVRNLSLADWRKHQSVMSSILEAKRHHLLSNAAVKDVQGKINGLLTR